MKKTWIFLLLMTLSCMLFVSCEKIAIPSEEPEEEQEEQPNTVETQTIKIKTRSITNDIQYPIELYAFDSEGKCSAQKTIKSASENPTFSLSSGSYHLVALSHTDGYDLPSSPTLTSLISISNASNYNSSPLQMGQTDVKVGEKTQTVNIILAYKVATVHLSLSDVPSSVTSVLLTISEQYSAMNMKGEYSSGKNSTVELTKSDNTWSTDICVFPGSTTQTVFSISLTDSDGTNTYGYTYNSPLSANIPYRLSGTYTADDLSLSATFMSEGWGTPIDLNFSFGPSGTTKPDDSSSQTVSSFPSPGTIWNNHLVAYLCDESGKMLDKSDLENCSSANVMLLSLNEWTNVKSANHATNKEEASDITTTYSEAELTGWSIPTSSEVENLTSLYSVSFETIDELNSTLTSIEATPVGALTDMDKYIRFLCDDAQNAFSWKASPNILPAGATVNYSLRLVKQVKVSK